MANAPGGFLESCDSTAVRPRPTLTLPTRGPFDFPAPYGTRGIRLTNASDMSGQDALWGNLYPYWCAMNAHAGQDRLLVLLGTDRQRGGVGPSLWAVDKLTDQVTPLGPLFPSSHALSWQTAEGWAFSATEPTILYAADETHRFRIDLARWLSGDTDTADVDVVVDVRAYRTGVIGWQWHTSVDGRVHS